MLKKITSMLILLFLGFVINCGNGLKTNGISPLSLIKMNTGPDGPAGPGITPPTISSISPNSGDIVNNALNATISGTDFIPGLSVRLVKGSLSITGSFITVSGPGDSISCTFDLTSISSADTGQWNVVVDNGDGGTATLANGFRAYETPAGLTNWWPMDGDVNDAITANGNTGAMNGGTAYGPDRFTPSNPSSAINGDGANGSYVNSSSHGAPILNSARTMMGWIKIDALNTNLVGNFLFGYGFAPSNIFTLGLSYNTATTFTLVFSSGTNIVYSNTLMKIGQWYHVAVTYDGASGIKLYVNGNLENSDTITALATPGSMPMYFFQFGSSVARTKGSIDDVRIHGSALTQAELQTIAAIGAYLLPPQNVTATKGSFPASIDIAWDLVPDATGYDIYRDTTMAFSGPVLLNATPLAVNSYTDPSVSAGTVYYYRIKARNSSVTSDYSEMTAGYTTGTIITEHESFESGFNITWNSVLAVGSTAYSYDASTFLAGATSLKVDSPSSSCSSGCEFTESFSLTKTFAIPISYFDITVGYKKLFLASGKVSIYVNNPVPTDDTGYVPFIYTSHPSGSWVKRTAMYQNVGNISSITILFYDITNTNVINADDITIHTKP